ncbi:MAG: histone H1-like repetitive region-containing protein [Polyangiaceae bacterium]
MLDGSLDLAAIHGDESIIEGALVKVRGIGRWTAEMFLMFRLGRLDILSTGDLGLRKGLMILNGLSDLPDPATMEKLTDHWRPFRSVGSWYLWRVAEGAPPHRTKPPTEKKAVAKKAVAKKAVTKKAVTKKAVTKKAVTKKAVAKKAVAKKAVAKKAVTKKAVTKKAVSAR